MRSISERLKRITTQPMEGFGDKTIFLANLGVTTTQDGQLILGGLPTLIPSAPAYCCHSFLLSRKNRTGCIP